jgi:molybdopterin synthase sulfur carrier subunit
LRLWGKFVASSVDPEPFYIDTWGYGNRLGCIIPTANVKLLYTMGPTPTITIHVPGPLRTYCAGAAQLSISAHTVRAALEDLQRSQSALYRNVCDETGTVRRHLNVFVNSDNVRDLDGVDTTLEPGDVVTILPAVSGG